MPKEYCQELNEFDIFSVSNLKEGRDNTGHGIRTHEG